MKVGSLCSGIGGLDLAVEHHFGADLAWYSELEPAPCQILERHWPGVPNLGDLTKLDWSQVEPVDVLTAGYPCQPFSHAGKRQGAEDVRHLWPYIAEAVRVLRPRWVVLENVAGHLSLGFGDVLGDLAEAGFDAEWCVLRASDVGACHQRARLWIVATDTRAERRDRWPDLQGEGGHSSEWSEAGDHAGDGGASRHGAPADAGGERHGGRQDGGAVGRVDRGDASEALQRQRARPVAGDRSDATPADTGGMGRGPGTGLRPDEPGGERRGRPCDDSRPTDWGPYEAAITRWAAVIGRPAPAPTDDAGRLSPAFVTWMQGYPQGWVDGLTRTQALKALGNAVVPQQAGVALTELVPA